MKKKYLHFCTLFTQSLILYQNNKNFTFNNYFLVFVSIQVICAMLKSMQFYAHIFTVYRFCVKACNRNERVFPINIVLKKQCSDNRLNCSLYERVLFKLAKFGKYRKNMDLCVSILIFVILRFFLQTNGVHSCQKSIKLLPIVAEALSNSHIVKL